MKHYLGLVLILACNISLATEWNESAEVETLFKQAGVKGTFVLYDVASGEFTGYAQARAETRFVPASTFKVPHSLIGVSVQAVKDVDEVLPYGGQPQPFESWEQDMGLRDAIKISNVPVYQALARRITLEPMQQALVKMDYGNAEVGTVIDRFWLDGPLKISAIEQTLFLARLAQGELPFPEELQEQVRAITLVEQEDDWALYAKTGWGDAPEPGIGWWVGWVVKRGKVYSFALNIDIWEAGDAAKRVELGRLSLQSLGVL